jgi:hypothetical protein
MNQTNEEVKASTEPMLPCLVLCQIQSDLSAIAKSKALPFNEVYHLTPEVSIEITIQKLDDLNFHMQVKSPGIVEATDLNFKKLLEVAHQHITRAVSTCLSRIDVDPCPTMSHLGADEILALYKCMSTFKAESVLPYTYSVQGPRGKYELFSAKETNNHFEIAFETNYIYGNSMRWRAEVEFINQALDRADKIMADALGEWLRPGGSSLRPTLSREKVATPAKS